MLGQFGNLLEPILPQRKNSSLFFASARQGGGGALTLGFGNYGKYLTEKIRREEQEPMWLKDAKRLGIGIGIGTLAGGAFGAIDNARGFSTNKKWYAQQIGKAAGIGALAGGSLTGAAILASNLLRKPKPAIIGRVEGKDNG